jgi:DNA-binding CsgD family transcriptional regulator
MSQTEPLSPTLPDLTPKQREVLALVADNRTSKEIAARLGVSESAVNQRIESVRTRLGGIPRGELARLFRQLATPEEPSADETTSSLFTWQKIHLPDGAQNLESEGVEGIPSAPAGSIPSYRIPEQVRNGSQLSAFRFGRNPAKPPRGSRPTAFARVAAVLSILIAGMMIAAGVTALIGPAMAMN